MQSAKIFISFLIVTASGIQQPNARKKFEEMRGNTFGVSFSANGQTSTIKELARESIKEVRGNDAAISFTANGQTAMIKDLQERIKVLEAENADLKETRLRKVQALYIKVRRNEQQEAGKVAAITQSAYNANEAYLNGTSLLLKTVKGVSNIIMPKSAGFVHKMVEEVAAANLALSTSARDAESSLGNGGGLLQTTGISQLAERLAKDLDTMFQLEQAEIQYSADIDNILKDCESSPLAICTAMPDPSPTHTFGTAVHDIQDSTTTLLQQVRKFASLLESRSKLLQSETQMSLEAVEESQAMELESYIHKVQDIVCQNDAALDAMANSIITYCETVGNSGMLTDMMTSVTDSISTTLATSSAGCSGATAAAAPAAAAR